MMMVIMKIENFFEGFSVGRLLGRVWRSGMFLSGKITTSKDRGYLVYRVYKTTGTMSWVFKKKKTNIMECFTSSDGYIQVYHFYGV